MLWLLCVNRLFAPTIASSASADIVDLLRVRLLALDETAYESFLNHPLSPSESPIQQTSYPSPKRPRDQLPEHITTLLKQGMDQLHQIKSLESSDAVQQMHGRTFEVEVQKQGLAQAKRRSASLRRAYIRALRVRDEVPDFEAMKAKLEDFNEIVAEIEEMYIIMVTKLREKSNKHDNLSSELCQARKHAIDTLTLLIPEIVTLLDTWTSHGSSSAETADSSITQLHDPGIVETLEPSITRSVKYIDMLNGYERNLEIAQDSSTIQYFEMHRYSKQIASCDELSRIVNTLLVL